MKTLLLTRVLLSPEDENIIVELRTVFMDIVFGVKTYGFCFR